jgi:16S rRNA (cytidine1402-2'-O)-methyltransferase
MPKPGTPGPAEPTDDSRPDAAAPLASGLYVVATPIGNLGDVTLRALEVLARADVIACEDTRVTRKLLDRHGLRARLAVYNDHSSEADRARLLARIEAGGAVALVSDAGTPLISDPGYKLVRAAAERGLRVVPIPGPSAALAALMASGLPTDRFFFEGFLPGRSGERRRRIEELKAIPATLVLYESPHRLPDALRDLVDILGDRDAAVARELTKAFEEIRRGRLAELAAFYSEHEVRGEVVIVLGPPELPAPPPEADVDAMLADALARLSLKDAAAAVAEATGLPKRVVYQRALAFGKDREP